MSEVKKDIEEINKRLSNIEVALKDISSKLDNDIKNECKKMGTHIDFIESVYDNVKHPLGYITNKIKFLSSKEDKKKYTLTSTDNNEK